MRIKSILISIVIAATAGMWCACNDDLDLGVNDAKLEKVEGFRISKFTTDRLNWAIDNGADIRIVFHSNADDALYEFSMTVDNSGSKPVYAIHIPEKQTIPDGEYDALAFLGNGKAICPRMKFKIIKEIVEEIQAREGKFRLPGHGTQEKPKKRSTSLRSDFAKTATQRVSDCFLSRLPRSTCRRAARLSPAHIMPANRLPATIKATASL